MKRKALLAAAVLLMISGTAALSAQEGSPWSVHARLDVFAFSVKAGAEYGFTDQFGLSGSLGVCVINPLFIIYALTGVSHLMPPDRGLQVDVEYGLVQASLMVIETDNPSAYWVTGACITVGYRFPGGHQISLRTEAGAMFGYDLGAWRGPLFMPNLGLEYSWRMP
jgi:hypothetical protein